jgi:Rieske Fe-S protein
MEAQEPSGQTGIAPLAFAIGVVVLLVGLVVNPLVIVPLGGAIALVAAVGWIRHGGRTAPQIDEEPLPSPVAATEERYSRSRLLERTTLALGGLVGLGVALPAVGFTVLPSILGQRRKPVDLGPTSAFPLNQFVIATFLADPQAGEVSRRAAYVRNNGFLGSEPSFTIMSSRCTHVGCPTQPNGLIFTRQGHGERTRTGEVGLVPTQPSGGFGCPCHGSQFDTEGNRTAGPAPRALDRYKFSIRNGHLWLEDLYSVSRVDGTGAQARIHAFARLGDGEPASGPESLLYPLDPIS